VTRKPTFLVLGAAAAALGVAACGGGGGSSSSSTSSAPASTPASATSTPAPASSTTGGSTAPSGGGSTLKIAADPSGALAFNKKTLSAKTGRVTISMANPSPIPHGIAVQGSQFGVNRVGKVVGKGGTSTLSFFVKPGRYTFYCPVPGHRQAGMDGVLTVQ
jgi:plastocyanin